MRAHRIQLNEELGLQHLVLVYVYSMALIFQGSLVFRSRVAGGPNVVPLLAIEILLAGPLLFFMARRLPLKWSGLYIAQMGAMFAGAYFFVKDWTVWGSDILTDDLVLSDSLAVIAVGVGACLLAVLLQSRCSVCHPLRETAPSLGPVWGSWRFWLLSYIATIGLDAFAQSERLGFLLVALKQWPLYSIIALDVLGRTGRAPREIHHVVWWMLVPFRIVMAFATGFGMFVIHDAVILLYYLSMKQIIRIRLYGVASFVLLGIVVFAGRSYIRDVIWQQYGPETTRLNVAARAISGLWNYSMDDFLAAANSLASDRIGHYGLVAHTLVVRDTPDSVPYLYGESLYQFLWALVPRALYPDKPTEDWGQRFGHRYGLLAPADTYTSFNMPEITEAYANGGIWLVLVLMFTIAWLVGRVSSWTERLPNASDDILWIILPVAFGYLSDCQSNFSLSVNAALYSALILALPTLVKRCHRARYAREHNLNYYPGRLY